jgi:hypothetical protein
MARTEHAAMVKAPICIAAVAAATFVSGASATESTIYPGVGIGKVKLGLTLTQVKHVLGSDAIVNDRETINGSEYLELGWNFSAWAVGFARHGSTYHAVHVTTALHAQRTTTGVGPGTFWLTLVKAYPGGACTFTYGPTGGLEYLVPHKGGTQTIFLLHGWPPRAGSYGIPLKTYSVISVGVRVPYQPLPEFARDWPGRCKAGYESTPRPTQK